MDDGNQNQEQKLFSCIFVVVVLAVATCAMIYTLILTDFVDSKIGSVYFLLVLITGISLCWINFVEIEDRDANENTEPDIPFTEKIDMDGYKEKLRYEGVAGVRKKLNEDLNNWKNIELHTAVTGSSGAGKSSFINAIRGIKAGQQGAAKTGYEETTMECQSYIHPCNRSFVVWDLPGAGTKQFPRKSYLKQVNYDRYDFFIIISNVRFTEDDLWLALEVQKQNKMFFFVRSCIDNDIASDKRDNPYHNEKKLIDDLRTRLKFKLVTGGVKDPDVFLISNYARDKYDFGTLNDQLLGSCDGLKKEAMALSLQVATEEVMKEKKKLLQGRITQVAMCVACSQGQYEEKSTFVSEIKLYQTQFNIDEVTFAQNNDILFLSEECIEKYKIVFDESSAGREREVTTPTAQREKESAWNRFKDCFNWSKEQTLLYRFCETALNHNLKELYRQARSLYNLKRTNKIVHAMSTSRDHTS